MKFTVTFKDPDALQNALEEAAIQSIRGKTKGLTEKQVNLLVEDEIEELRGCTEKWIEWSEYLKVEFDTIAGTATVLPKG